MTARSVVVRLDLDTARAIAKSREFGSEMTRSMDQAEQATDQSTKAVDKSSRAIEDLSEKAGKIGAVAGVGFAAAVSAAANFDEAMDAVQASTSETTANMELLRQAALDAGQDTVYSATEAADGIEQLAKAGVSTADILGGALTGALDLAASGNIAVGDAAEYTATALTQFQLAGEEATHVADLLAAGAGKAQGEVSDMALALDYAGVPAANLGVSIEETAGTIALLASNGVIGEKAGTALRGMLSSLTSPSVAARKEMERLGISVFDAQGEFIGFEGVAGQLEDRLGTLTEEERANALGKIFGNEQLQAANVLYREGADGIAEWTENVDDAGFAAEAAATRLDNLKGDFEALKGAAETALIGTGDGSQGQLRELTQGITRAVNAYNDLGDGSKNAVSDLLAITAVTGGGLWFGSKVIGAVATTRASLVKLGFAADTTTGKFTRLIGTAGSFAAVAYSIYGVAEALDTVSRRSAVANGEIETFADLQAVIADSSLTEYADRLGIDLQKLTDDLAANGREGEYVQKVLAGLNDEGGKWSTLLQTYGQGDEIASLFGVDLGLNAEEATEAQKQLMELLALLDETGEIAGSTASEIDGVAAAGSQPVDMSWLNDWEGGVRGVGNAFAYTEEEIKDAQEAYDAAVEMAQGAADSFAGLDKKARESRLSLNDWVKQLEEQAAAVANFADNIVAARKNGVSDAVVDTLSEMGTDGALILQQLADATDDEVERANRAWGRNQAAVQGLIDTMAKVPKPLRVDVDTERAISRIDALQEKLDRLNEGFVNIRHDAPGGGTPGFGPRSEVPGLAGGGPIHGPGSGTSDSIPARLSNGEHVWTAREVSNAGGHGAVASMRSVYAYAAGGPVGEVFRQNPSGTPWRGGSAAAGTGHGGGGFDLDYERLGREFARLRPLHGDVHVTDGYGGFKKQMEEDLQQAQVAGW